MAEAVGHYREIVKKKPDSHGIALKLAWCLSTCSDEEVRDSADAIRLAERVAEATKRQSPMVLDVLAAAYAAAGRFETALKTIDEATNLVDADSTFRQLLIKRRELYERKQSIRLQKTSK
jgi:tetratricopeptide (TPR) repeat protein